RPGRHDGRDARDGEVPDTARRHPHNSGVHRGASGEGGGAGDRGDEHGADDGGRDGARPLAGRAAGARGVTDVQTAPEVESFEPGPRAPCICESYARVTERAALAGARWLGRADQDAAEEAAFSGARYALESLPISGRIVIGAPEGSEQLAAGTLIGA